MQMKTRNIFIITGLISLIILSLLTVYFLNNDFWALRHNPFGTSKLNILVVGYDSTINGPPRADTIILASIDLKTKEVGLLSIPRDTRVNIPEYGMNRVNASHAFGGVELTVATLEDYLEVPIEYFVETDFQGFARIIDAIGGVDITIEKPLHYVDNAGDLYIDLPAGNQRLNGEESLQYVRYREVIKGDIGRVERQQKFMKAMMKRILNPDIITKLPSVYNETKKAVNTNIPIQDVTPFVRLMKDMNLSNIDTVMLPGEPKYINGASYWIANQDELEIVVNNLIRSKEYIRNGQYEVAIKNGNGVNGQASIISDEMEKYGFEVISVGNADNYDYQKTLIIYYDKNMEEIVKDIQAVVGGKVELLELDEEETVEEDVQIIIGADNLETGNNTNG
ncbi:MAG: LCP family protein [Halanaerobiales bacterium]